MAQWTVIDPNTLLPGDPWTSAKAQAAFENLEAVAEGAPDAPRVQGAGLDLFIGRVSAAQNVYNGFTDLESSNVLTVVGTLSQIRTSTDNGSTWNTALAVVGEPIVNLHTGEIFSNQNAQLVRTDPAPINAVQVRNINVSWNGIFSYLYRGDGL